MLKKLSVNFGHLFQNNLEMLQHAWPHPIKLNWSKCSFQGCQTKWKIWNLFTPAIVFNKLKIKKVSNELAKFIFTYNSRTRFYRYKAFGIIIKATMLHHLTSPTPNLQKKPPIDGPIFFSKSIMLIYFRVF